MPRSLLEMAAEIVSGQSNQRTLSAAEIRNLLRETFIELQELERLESTGTTPQSQLITAEMPESLLPAEIKSKPKIDPAESIKENVIICLECGGEYRQLTHRHLREHGVTPAQYRKKYSLPAKQPLTATSVSEKRRTEARERNIGEQLKQARAAKKSGQVKESKPIE